MMDFLDLFGVDLLRLVSVVIDLWRIDREERFRMRPAPVRVPVRR